MEAYVPLFIWWALLAVPAAVLVRRLGLATLWLVTLAVPLLGPLVMLWIMAFKTLPNLRTQEAR